MTTEQFKPFPLHKKGHKYITRLAQGGTGFTMLTHAEQGVPRQFPRGILLQNVVQDCSD